MREVKGPVACRTRFEPELQAWLVTPDNVEQVAAWAGGGYWPKSVEPLVWLRADQRDPVEHADIKVEPGEYVVQGITGHFFRVTAAEFTNTYQEIPR